MITELGDTTHGFVDEIIGTFVAEARMELGTPPVIYFTENYTEDHVLISKYWNVIYRGKEYGPFMSYDEAEKTKHELAP